MNGSGLTARLSAIVGPDRTIVDRRALRIYRGGPWGSGDPEGRFGHTPRLAVRPVDATQVAACLAEVTAAGHPAIALGGGTGLTGAGLAEGDSVVLDLRDLEAIEIDRPSRRARVGAGAILENVAKEADRQRLLFAHDPWSQPLASVGGAIATNGVGYLAAGYGTMGAQVLGLQVALPDGTLLDLPSAWTSSTGPDLSRLFIGAEGTLGVVTAATVRLFPKPERELLRGYDFPSFESGFAALQESADAGLRLAMIDYEEEDAGGASELIVRVDGVAGAAEATAERLSRIAEARDGTPMPDRRVKRFWRERHSSALRFRADLESLRQQLQAGDDEPPVGRSRGGWRYLHLALPAGQVLPFLAEARARASSRGCRIANAGIWGAPELLSFVVDGSDSDKLAEELQTEAAALGGSFEYCHGVGLRMGRLMSRSPAFPLLRRVKSALDPAGLLNPGKQGL